MIAYHFPPLAGSSGIQRTLRFARDLPAFGWQPVVLTAHPRAYARCSADQLADIPAQIEVIRAPAWDTSRHLAIAGRYPGWLARPDRWASWWWGAVPAGLRALRRGGIDAIWSTYPIASAHRIGATLARLSGLPWIADFRDPMVQPGYPADARIRDAFTRIEGRAMARARFVTLTTAGAGTDYQGRYPERAEAVRVIENGYDEASFAELSAAPATPLNPGYRTLLHSGVVYPSERDPRALFAALAQLVTADGMPPLRVRLRAAVHESLLRRLAREHGVEPLLELLPPLPYREALAEMVRADGLLVLQAANCNQQVPAKLYEYLRAGRPILALTDPAGDTAGVVAAAGLDTIAPLDDSAAIMALLRRFLAAPQALPLPANNAVVRASRHERGRELAGLLDRCRA